MKPTLAILFEYPTLNGGEYSMLSVLPLLADRYSLFAATPTSGPLLESLKELGVPTVPFDLHDSDSVRLSRPLIGRAIDRVIQQTGADLVHANSLNMARLLGDWRSNSEFPGKATGHLRDIIKLSGKAAADLSRLDRLAAVSEAVRTSRIEQGMPPERVEVIHNGVDLTEFRSRPATGWLHDKLALPRETMIVGSIGQIGMRKGVSYLVEAAAQVVLSEPRSAFVYVGERHSNKQEAVEYETQLRAAAESEPLKGRFFFLGRRPDIARLLPELTVFAHAALQEPLGRVLLEAAATGLPIVATRVGGTAEIFPVPTQAILTPPKEAAAFAAALLTLLTDSHKRQSLAAAAKQRMEAAFSVDQAAEQLHAFWQRALSD